ncbi:MAG: DUF882 domain-containing protein [Caulobacterales bacterium]
MNRRDILKFAGGAAMNAALVGGLGAAMLSSATATTAPSAPRIGPSGVQPAARRLSFVNTHTGETFRGAYCEGGVYQSDALSEINRVMRDHRSNEVHAIDRNLLDQLTDLHVHLGASQPYQIISGYRSPATNAALHANSSGVATRSLHMDGRAIDVRIAGVDLIRLRDTAIANQRGGVGYYQASDFVHLDTGRVRRW